MELRRIVETANGTVLVGNNHLGMDIRYAASADLMSDVLAFAKPRSLLITGLANAQVIRTAEMADIAAVLIVRGKRPEQAAIALAEEKDIPLIVSPYTMFELCGRLYQAGMVGCDADS